MGWLHRGARQPLQRPGRTVRNAGRSAYRTGWQPDDLSRRGSLSRAPSAAIRQRRLGADAGASLHPVGAGFDRRTARPRGLRGGRTMELTELCSKLKFEHLPAQLETLCEQAAKRELNYQEFLNQVLMTEWQSRR